MAATGVPKVGTAPGQAGGIRRFTLPRLRPWT